MTYIKRSPATIREIKITKQFKGLDVLIEVNGNQAILIEDKTYTKEQSNQLNHYYEEVAKLERYNECNLLPFYYKIGNQSDYSEVIDAKYMLFTKKQMFKFLQENIENEIQGQSGYIANPNGGFYALWWNEQEVNNCKKHL